MSTAALPLTFDLNPKFRYRSHVHWDELDALRMLHNSRFAAHVERATIAFYESLGRRWSTSDTDNPDQFHVVRDFHIEFLAPVRLPGPIDIDLWVERLGTSSCVYGFRCASADGGTLHARGDRTIVKLDPESKRAVAWTDVFRRAHLELLKDLPSAP